VNRTLIWNGASQLSFEFYVSMSSPSSLFSAAVFQQSGGVLERGFAPATEHAGDLFLARFACHSA
jgi:hypothetical protein